ncbi:unnamed protein product [Phytomonas sp. Hart1]|nr:unnamed protein product [Phytomonas sp. Hart1]|eukprot:CCW69657.1 unnamed protein product [Phytomonas sp. isolate Hart1]
MQLEKQVELLKKQLADLHGKFALTEADRKRLSGLLEERNLPQSKPNDHLNHPNAEDPKTYSSVNQSVQESLAVHRETEKNELKRMQREAVDFKRKLVALQKDLDAKDAQIDKYRKQLSTGQKRSNADVHDSSPKLNWPTSDDREIHKKREHEIRRLQKSMETIRGELQQVKQDKHKLQLELNDANERASLATKKAVVEKNDQKSIAVLRRKVDNFLSDASRDAATIQCLKNELQAAQEELRYETEARAKFEELAAQAINRNNHVPKSEVVRLQQQLQECNLQLRQAHAEADETRRNAQKEIQELKNWCAQLRERQDKQMHDMEVALRNSSTDPQRNRPTGEKVQVPDLQMKTLSRKYTGGKLLASARSSHQTNNGTQEQEKKD